MTTLYKTVPITSLEQAEALPVGSVILSPGGHPAMKYLPGSWILVGTPSYRSNEQTIGSTVLVPVEAEEEVRISTTPRIKTSPNRVTYSNTANVTRQTRLVTPWEVS